MTIVYRFTQSFDVFHDFVDSLFSALEYLVDAFHTEDLAAPSDLIWYSILLVAE